jgi:DHA1 family tetracycline resistance protein-like MFS transporter
LDYHISYCVVRILYIDGAAQIIRVLPISFFLAGGAFILAFPIGGILGAKYGPRVPLLAAAAIQFVNALLIIFVTPESNTNRSSAKLDLREANPIGCIKRLFFGNNQLLRIASACYFLASLARNSLDAQFANYSNIRFGWTQAQSGPVLVLVRLMLAIAPPVLVPMLGLKNSILGGLLVFALGLTATGLAPTPLGFVGGIWIVALGCICLPSLQALLPNMAPEGELGALLGAVGSLTELTGGIGSTLFGTCGVAVYRPVLLRVCLLCVLIQYNSMIVCVSSVLCRLY